MKKEQHIIPDSAIKGIATGLIMMAVFTSLWAGIGYGGLKDTGYWFVLIIFPALSVLFVVNAIKLFNAAKHFPKLTSEADIAEEKRMGKWFGIIFGTEGLGIFIGINVVINLGHPELTMPVLALVVGLHFFPLAKVFKRTIDYYLATWSTVIAILSIALSLNKTLTQSGVFTLLGIGIGIATSCYGIYMITEGKRLYRLQIG
ncbi:hypothetical protein JN11_02972 [Mucilaginibacter frigoritolerans]|uniref:Uncharacterized protein n=1 Tax=Mucilaginibacter frigoritolerans TaxID=652788 RepID=A0A562U076_9SPHI|nr:hypothetical protein [Mucilaginibacter frigoritolerans]TWI98784.1 hypothetical protein JN11_02972 [Mucilaginibacter frigoritolerans]